MQAKNPTIAIVNPKISAKVSPKSNLLEAIATSRMPKIMNTK